jgi:hypothetical protein
VAYVTTDTEASDGPKPLSDYQDGTELPRRPPWASHDSGAGAVGDHRCDRAYSMAGVLLKSGVVSGRVGCPPSEHQTAPTSRIAAAQPQGQRAGLIHASACCLGSRVPPGVGGMGCKGRRSLVRMCVIYASLAFWDNREGPLRGSFSRRVAGGWCRMPRHPSAPQALRSTRGLCRGALD